MPKAMIPPSPTVDAIMAAERAIKQWVAAITEEEKAPVQHHADNLTIHASHSRYTFSTT